MTDLSADELQEQEGIAICMTCQTPMELCDGMATPDPDICPLVAVINARPERNKCDHGKLGWCGACRGRRLLRRVKDAVREQTTPLTVRELADKLGVGISSIHTWTRKGELKFEKRDIPFEQRLGGGARKAKYIIGVREDEDES